jgi:hypothetical protein
MSVKPELTLACLKESRKYHGAECPVGTFVVRLYWEDYSQYNRSEKRLNGVYLLKDSKNIYHRVCEFAITSLESLEHLVANCNPPSGSKATWFRNQTKINLFKFKGYAQAGYRFLKPIKVSSEPLGLTLDDIAPALVEQHSEVLEHTPASDRQVRQMMADGYKANARRCKQWVIGVGKSIPGFEIVLKSSDKRKTEVIMQQVIENILLAELSVSQLRDIIAAS